MENILVSLRVVFPLFFMLALGYGIQRSGMVSKEVFDGCSTIVFHFILPIYLFVDIQSRPFNEVFDAKLLFLVVSCVIAYWVIAMLTIPLLQKNHRKQGVMVQGAFRSNFVLFGLPVVQALVGSEATSLAAMVIAVVVPLYNVLAVITLETFRKGKPNVKSILRSIFKNQLILSCLVGIAWSLAGWGLPDLVTSSLKTVGSISTPLAIIALGGTFRFSALKENAGPLLYVLGQKLLVMPAIFLAVGVLGGLRGAALAVMLSVCATPTAVSSYPMAQRMNGDGQLAGQIVVLTTLFSIVTLFLWVLLLTSFGLI